MIAIQRSQSLRQQVYQALKQIILQGDLASGERVVETRLAEQLQVSRTPIREAIGQLKQEKLIVSKPNGGFKVATLSIQDAIQLYDCRIALEQLSVGGACENITSKQIKRLEQCVLLAENSVQSKSNQSNTLKLLEIDYQFHHLIAESSGNQWLLALLEQVFDKMALLRVQTTKHNPQVLEIRLEHREVYKAIASKEINLAQEMIKEHLIASKDRVVRELEIIKLELTTSKITKLMTIAESDLKQVFICGSALKGQPDHQNLTNAKFIKATKTLPQYRLHAAEAGWHPAIYAVGTGGISIPGEIYQLTEEQYAYLLANEPPHMYPDTVNLAGGEQAIAMLYPQELVEKYNWPDISEFGGWAAYQEQLTVSK